MFPPLTLLLVSAKHWNMFTCKRLQHLPKALCIGTRPNRSIGLWQRQCTAAIHKQ